MDNIAHSIAGLVLAEAAVVCVRDARMRSR
jgi:hypothetical protein